MVGRCRLSSNTLVYCHSAHFLRPYRLPRWNWLLSLPTLVCLVSMPLMLFTSCLFACLSQLSCRPSVQNMLFAGCGPFWPQRSLQVLTEAGAQLWCTWLLHSTHRAVWGIWLFPSARGLCGAMSWACCLWQESLGCPSFLIVISLWARTSWQFLICSLKLGRVCSSINTGWKVPTSEC